MSRLQTMIKHLPIYERQSRVITSILTPAAVEIDRVQAELDEALKQFYVETATAWGLDLWERMLGLKSYAGKPLDHRRSRIIAKLRGVGAVNVKMIKSVAESFLYGIVEATENPTAYKFMISFVDTRGIPPNLYDLQAAIEDIKPAHLEVEYIFIYATYGELKDLTYGDMTAHTYGDLKLYE